MIYKVKAINPNWRSLGIYDEHGEYDTLEEAQRQKRHLQDHRWVKVIIKQRKK